MTQRPTDLQPAAAPSPRPRGRPAGANTSTHTRQRIIDAARQRFTTDGYTATSMRAIARDADVDPALLPHYFTSKQHLFLEAHQIPADPLLLIGPALDADPHQRGYTLAHTFLTRFLTDPHHIGTSLIKAATTEPAAAELLRNTLQHALLNHATALTTHPDSTARAAAISGMLLGIVFHHRILHLEPLTTLDINQLAHLTGPAIQALLDTP